MILPIDLKKIVGKNPRRDYLVCKAFLDGKTQAEIGSTFGISQRRVSTILYQNASFLNPLVAWPKSYRIMRLQRLANKLEGVTNKTRDEVDILVELRRETEGEKSPVTIDQSTHTHMTIVDLAKMIGEKKLAKDGERSDRGGDGGACDEPRFVLKGDIGGQPLEPADRDNGGGAGQSEGNGQVG